MPEKPQPEEFGYVTCMINNANEVNLTDDDMGDAIWITEPDIGRAIADYLNRWADWLDHQQKKGGE